MELTLEEGKTLLDQTAAMGTSLVVFTGGGIRFNAMTLKI